MQCPLCENDSIEYLESININNLNGLYKKIFHIDIFYLFDAPLSFCRCQVCKLKFFYPLITGDENFYNVLQKNDWYYMDEKNEYEFALRYIKKNDKVLEIGSGKAAFSKKIPATEYTGLDFSLEAQKMAKQSGINILNETIETHSKNNCYYDVVISFQVLEHISDPKSFIEHSLAALKNNGLLIIAIPSEDSFLKYVSNGILNMPPHHVTRWSDKTLRFIAKKYDLDIVELYHEKVQSVHVDWYYSTLFYSLLFDKLNFHQSLLKTSLVQKIILKISTFITKSSAISLDENLLPNGHTVVIVYKKK